MNALYLTIVYKFAKDDLGALVTSNLPITNTQVGFQFISSVVNIVQGQDLGHFARLAFCVYR